MKSFNKAYNVQDYYHTPPMLVEMLKPFIAYYYGYSKLHKKDPNLIYRPPTIFCPFDTCDSEYVRIFKQYGYNVIHGSIETGQDFFELPIPERADLVISNPPFSRKLDVFRRLVNAGKPFAMLMNLMAINYQEIGEFFSSLPKGDIQFIIPDKKVSFNGKTSSFCSGYVCYKFIDHTEFVHLPHNNTGKNFEPAFRYKRSNYDKRY